MLQKLFQSSKKAKNLRIFIIILLMVGVAGIVNGGAYYNRAVDKIYEKTSIKLPHTKEVPFRLGLDLQGGTHLVYEADFSSIQSSDQVSALEGVRDVIERRVNVFGVSEPLVQTSPPNRVVVELAGITDVNEAINMIGETPLLEFKEQVVKEREMTEEETAEMNEFNQKAEEKATEVLSKIKSGSDFSELAKEYSDDENTKENGGDLGYITYQTDRELYDLVKDYEVGQSNTELEKGVAGYEFLKLTDKRKKTNPFKNDEVEKEVKASHILICHNEAENCSTDISKEDALQKIKEIEKEATAANFADLAKKNSVDSSAENGGDLGWFSRGMMVAPFEETVFDNQKVGEVSYIVETMYGYHLILKEAEREVDELKVSRILVATKSKRDYVNEVDWQNTELTGKNLERAMVQFNPNDNMPEVGLQFDEEGGKMFEAVTERNVGRQVAIFLDSLPISVPNVNEKISGGKAVISGKFTVQEAKLLAQRLNAGALPVPVNLVSQQTVGASLGKESIKTSMEAGVIGLIIVAVFMILYYRLPGLISVISLLIYGMLILFVFKIWPVTLSLSGLAGFVLSIGMAVDANVLIFERLKEELREGKPLSISIQNAFDRAWPSIRDGNVSTLVTCFILIQFTTSVVKGFAITLALGIIISMFSAIIVTKNLLDLFFGRMVEKRKWLIMGR